MRKTKEHKSEQTESRNEQETTSKQCPVEKPKQPLSTSYIPVFLDTKHLETIKDNVSNPLKVNNNR